ncbi:hypothetical protein B5P22_31105 [Pseudomonas tolaasii]|uniref:hypothetical protein n=1 Tax=Pseudomonas tolaasii TaxID=29442 RepID=UPI0009B69008|nr:hypothetical protein [Pseudomonas tolaasii]ARB31556.1 hypothetical protein B5P22_31105 [Pseudomonas tolaasii]
MLKAQILGQIKTIATRGANLDKLIQETGIGILEHMQEHREASLVCKLYNAMPNGSRKLALAHWLVKFGSVKVNKGTDSKAIPFKFDAEGTIDLVGAAGKAWYDCKKERDLKDEAFDLDAALYNFQAMLRKAQEKGALPVDERVGVLLGMPSKKAEKKAA